MATSYIHSQNFRESEHHAPTSSDLIGNACTHKKNLSAELHEIFSAEGNTVGDIWEAHSVSNVTKYFPSTVQVTWSVHTSVDSVETGVSTFFIGKFSDYMPRWGSFCSSFCSPMGYIFLSIFPLLQSEISLWKSIFSYYFSTLFICCVWISRTNWI